MKSKKFTKVLTMFLCTVMVIMIFPITASADMGPKPSVRITFENLGNEECWGPLLSSKESTGPSSAWNGKEEDAQHNENPNGYYSYQKFGYDIWKAFVDYAKNDGYAFDIVFRNSTVRLPNKWGDYLAGRVCPCL